MSKSVKATKAGLKDAHEMVESLKEMIRSDLKNQRSGFEEALSTRLNEAEDVILISAKAKVAIIAGVGVMRKDLDRAQRKFSKTNDVEELKRTLISLSQSLEKLRKTNDEIVKSLSKVLNPTLSAVEVVERFASDIQRSAGTWERHGRELDDSIMELCQDNQPAEMVELEAYIERQGYTVLLGEAHSSSDETE
jgi:DNA-binding ferritin-like protein